MAQAQPRQSIDAKTSKKGLPTLALCDTRDAPSTGSTLSEEQDFNSSLHPLKIVDTIFEL